MSIRLNLAGPFRGLPSLEPDAGPSLEPEEASSWELEEELPSLAPSDYGSLEGVGSPFQGLPSLAPGQLDVFHMQTIATVRPKDDKIASITRSVLGDVGVAYPANNKMMLLETAKRHLLERIEQEIATLESALAQLYMIRSKF